MQELVINFDGTKSSDRVSHRGGLHGLHSLIAVRAVDRHAAKGTDVPEEVRDQEQLRLALKVTEEIKEEEVMRTVI